MKPTLRLLVLHDSRQAYLLEAFAPHLGNLVGMSLVDNWSSIGLPESPPAAFNPTDIKFKQVTDAVQRAQIILSLVTAEFNNSCAPFRKPWLALARAHRGGSRLVCAVRCTPYLDYDPYFPGCPELPNGDRFLFGEVAGADLLLDLVRWLAQEITSRFGRQPNLRRDAFIIYSRKDSLLLRYMLDHFDNQGLSEFIDFWYDQRIEAGVEWSPEIRRKLETAHLVLFLVSSSSLAARSYCMREELPIALQQYKEGEIELVPILLSPCRWRRSGLRTIQCAPDGDRVLSEYAEPALAWAAVEAAVRAAVGRFR